MSLFDKIALNTDEPFRLLLFRPGADKDGNPVPWKDADGKQAWMDVMSSYSEKRADVARYLAEQKVAGKEYATQDDLTRAVAPFYITGWYLLDFENKPIDVECTTDNVRELFADRRCDYITEAARGAIVKAENFMPAPKIA